MKKTNKIQENTQIIYAPVGGEESDKNSSPVVVIPAYAIIGSDNFYNDRPKSDEYIKNALDNIKDDKVCKPTNTEDVLMKLLDIVTTNIPKFGAFKKRIGSIITVVISVIGILVRLIKMLKIIGKT